MSWRSCAAWFLCLIPSPLLFLFIFLLELQPPFRAQQFVTLHLGCFSEGPQLNFNRHFLLFQPSLTVS